MTEIIIYAFAIIGGFATGRFLIRRAISLISGYKYYTSCVKYSDKKIISVKLLFLRGKSADSMHNSLKMFYRNSAWIKGNGEQ